MNSTITVSVDSLQRKSQHLGEQLQKIQQEKNAVDYLLANLPAFGGDAVTTQLPDFQTQQSSLVYDPTLNTHDLVTEILRREGRKMKWSEVWTIVHQLKPDISDATVKYWLSKSSRDPKSPVQLNRSTNKYWYEEKQG